MRTKNELLESSTKWAAISPLFSKIIYSATIIGVMYYLYLMVDAIAGKTTLAYIFVTFLANINVQFALAASVTGLSITYGLYQKRQRKKTTERLHGRIKELEVSIDAHRSSSGLTTRGETNPIDKT